MIFINDGVVQMSTNPLEMAADLSAFYRALDEMVKQNNLVPQTANEIRNLADALSKIPEESLVTLFESLPKDKELSIEDIIKQAKDFQEFSKTSFTPGEGNVTHVDFTKNKNLS